MDGCLEPALVPELLVVAIDRGLVFRRDVCCFEIRYSRPEERIAYITLGSAHLILERIGTGRNWITGLLEAPLGRGIDFQITVPDTVPLAATLIRCQASRGYRAVSPYFREHLESRPVFVRLVGPGIAWAVCVQSYSTGVEDAPPANVGAPRSSVRSHSLLALAALDLFQVP